MSSFDIRITTQFLMNADQTIALPAVALARVDRYKQARLKAPCPIFRDPGREFEVKIPIYGGVLQELRELWGVHLKAYEHMVHVRWRGKTRFWGLITSAGWEETEEGWLDLFCRDPRAKLEHHHARFGDTLFDNENPEYPGKADHGRLEVDARGLRKLRDAANNLVGQAYPPLGIKDGTQTFPDSTELIDIERSQTLSRIWDDLCERTDGPQYDFVPLDIDPADPNYVKLDIKFAVGADRTQTVIFHEGFGLDNCKTKIKDDGPPVTHAHVVSQDNKFRVTTAASNAAIVFGVWIQWEQVDFNVQDQAEAESGLGAVGGYIVGNLAFPLEQVTLILPWDNPQSTGDVNLYFWEEDFFLGDAVMIEVKKGEKRLNHPDWTVAQVNLINEDSSGDVHQELEVIAWYSADLEDDSDTSP